MDFKYNIQSADGQNNLILEGRLDTPSAVVLENGIQPLIENPAQGLTVDLHALSYISSSGLRCLVRLFKSCSASGVPMRIAGATPPIKEIFDLTGFSKIFGL